MKRIICQTIIALLALILITFPSIVIAAYDDFVISESVSTSVVIHHPIIFIHGHTASNDGWRGIDPSDTTAMVKILDEGYFGYTVGNLNCDSSTILINTNGDTKKIYNFSYYGGQGAIGSNGNIVPKSSSIKSYYIGLLNSASWAQRLTIFIDKVLAATGSDKVDIIAHSMGGIVARSAIKWYGCKDKVHKLLMIGTPNKPTGESWYEGIFTSTTSESWMQNGELLELGVKYNYIFNTSTKEFDVQVMDRDTTFVDVNTGAEGKYLDLMNQGDWAQGVEYSVIAGNRSITQLNPKDDSLLNTGEVLLDGAVFNPVVYASHTTIPSGIFSGAAGDNSLTACTFTTEFIKRWIIDNSSAETGANNTGTSFLFPNPWKNNSCYLRVGIDNYKKALVVRTDLYNINAELIEIKCFPIYKYNKDLHIHPVYATDRSNYASGNYVPHLRVYGMAGLIWEGNLGKFTIIK